MPRVAFATCQTIPEPDTDEPLLLAACRKAGMEAECVPWEDQSVDWSAYDLAVVRSTWNYYQNPIAFRQWIRKVDSATRLCNPAAIMLGNIHKRYLSDLAEEGVPVVPTRFVEVGSSAKLGAMSYEQFVVKPAISAASYLTRVFSRGQTSEAATFMAEILKDRDAMVQEFMTSVAEGGEIALVHIDGELTHGIVKHPRYHGGEETVSEAVQPTPEQRKLAAQVLAAVKHPWLYARVDLMLGNEGKWLLSELELIEPSLFLSQHPPALDRLVKAIGDRIR